MKGNRCGKTSCNTGSCQQQSFVDLQVSKVRRVQIWTEKYEKSKHIVTLKEISDFFFTGNYFLIHYFPAFFLNEQVCSDCRLEMSFTGKYCILRSTTGKLLSYPYQITLTSTRVISAPFLLELQSGAAVSFTIYIGTANSSSMSRVHCGPCKTGRTYCFQIDTGDRKQASDAAETSGSAQTKMMYQSQVGSCTWHVLCVKKTSPSVCWSPKRIC